MGSKGSTAKTGIGYIRNTHRHDSQNLERVVYLIIYLCGGNLVRQQTKCDPTQGQEKVPADAVSGTWQEVRSNTPPCDARLEESTLLTFEDPSTFCDACGTLAGD
jgi:hypothetical protein